MPVSAAESPSVAGPARLLRRPAVPSWLLSAVFHMVLLLLVAATLRVAPRQGAAPEQTAEVGIVLKQSEGDETFYHSADDAGGGEAERATTATSSTDIAELISDQPPSDPGEALPSDFAVIGPGALEGGGVGSALGAAQGPRGTGHAIGGKARTSVFGIEGEGHKFVYVFDRSGSMGGSGRSPLAAAKAQLIASLQSLGKTHQFQIIFYNERSWRFNPTGHPNKMFFATEQNKQLATKFVGSVTADGSTRHEEALLAAIKMQPDVIFFLTDADEPQLWPAQLEKIHQRAAGITINTIEFGLGPQRDPNNFLVKLARQNGGRHAYVDVSRLRPGGVR